MLFNSTNESMKWVIMRSKKKKPNNKTIIFHNYKWKFNIVSVYVECHRNSRFRRRCAFTTINCGATLHEHANTIILWCTEAMHRGLNIEQSTQTHIVVIDSINMSVCAHHHTISRTNERISLRRRWLTVFMKAGGMGHTQVLF